MQVTADMAVSNEVPGGFGHRYNGADLVPARAAVLGDTRPESLGSAPDSHGRAQPKTQLARSAGPTVRLECPLRSTHLPDRPHHRSRKRWWPSAVMMNTSVRARADVPGRRGHPRHPLVKCQVEPGWGAPKHATWR